MGKRLKEGTVNAVNSDTAQRIKEGTVRAVKSARQAISDASNSETAKRLNEGIHTALERGSNSYAAKVTSDYIRDNTPSISEHIHSLKHVFYPGHPTLDRVINADTPIRNRNPATIINATSRPNEPAFVPPFVSNVTTAPITVRTKRKHHKNPTNAPTSTAVSVNFPSQVMPTSPPPPLSSVPPPPVPPVVRPVPVRAPVVRPVLPSDQGDVIFTSRPQGMAHEITATSDETSIGGKAVVPYVAPEVKKEEVVNNKIKERAVGRLPDNVDMNLVNYYISHPAKINTSRTYNYSNIKDRQLIAARYLSTK
jgi:hypothetical protein